MDKLADEAGQQISRGQNVAITSTNSRFIPQFRKTTAYLLSTMAKKVIEERKIQLEWLERVISSPQKYIKMFPMKNSNMH